MGNSMSERMYDIHQFVHDTLPLFFLSFLPAYCHSPLPLSFVPCLVCLPTHCAFCLATLANIYISSFSLTSQKFIRSAVIQSAHRTRNLHIHHHKVQYRKKRLSRQHQHV